LSASLNPAAAATLYGFGIWRVRLRLGPPTAERRRPAVGGDVSLRPSEKRSGSTARKVLSRAGAVDPCCRTAPRLGQRAARSLRPEPLWSSVHRGRQVPHSGLWTQGLGTAVPPRE